MHSDRYEVHNEEYRLLIKQATGIVIGTMKMCRVWLPENSPAWDDLMQEAWLVLNEQGPKKASQRIKRMLKRFTFRWGYRDSKRLWLFTDWPRNAEKSVAFSNGKDWTEYQTRKKPHPMNRSKEKQHDMGLCTKCGVEKHDQSKQLCVQCSEQQSLRESVKKAYKRKRKRKLEMERLEKREML